MCPETAVFLRASKVVCSKMATSESHLKQLFSFVHRKSSATALPKMATSESSQK
jgi:hypothetical protein